MYINKDGTPLQRGMLRDSTHYSTSRMAFPKRAIILEVKCADHPNNRSNIDKEDSRGFLAEARVWLVDDCAVMEHVTIPPTSASGLDNFEELLPRGSTNSVKGVEVDENISNVDPNDLDGDWCIIQFIDGNIQNPYISSYWPNPRNTYDPSTSGYGNQVEGTGRGTALNQSGRYFRRINGVETTISKEGNIVIDTGLAGSKISPGAVSNDGRFPRSTYSSGGSILTYIKPSQSLEVTWADQPDGIGVDSLFDPSLPQRNPAVPPPKGRQSDNTSIRVTSSNIRIKAPLSFEVRTKSSALIEAPSIYLGENASDFAAKTIPTNANFATLVAAYNSLVAVVNSLIGVVATPMVVTGAADTVTGAFLPGSVTVPTPPAPPSPTLPSLPTVTATKVYVE